MAARRSRRPPRVAAVAKSSPDVVSVRVLIDSGPLIALFNARDGWHGRVLEWLRVHPDIRLVTTWSVLTEVTALLARRVRNEAALDFLR